MTGSGTDGRARGGRSLPWAVAVALLVRLAAMGSGFWEPTALTRWYLRSAASLASGQGLLARRTPPGQQVHASEGVVEVLRARQDQGGRVDGEHPYPADTTDWGPATLRPAGYAVVLWALYRIANYDGMVLLAHLLQVLCDAFVVPLLFVAGRNLFSRRVGLWAAWVFAVLPPAALSTAQLLPDAFTPFFIALVTCGLSFVERRPAAVLAAGAAVGLGCHFRPELLLLAPGTFVATWALRRSVRSALAWTAGATAACLLVLSPWVAYTQRTLGSPRLTTTSRGATLYQALGEDPDNPWGIVLSDDWIEADAWSRGFTGAWSVEADAYYAGRFREAVAEHPGAWLGLVLLDRLPLALAPPYTFRTVLERREFSFTRLRVEEGLDRWEVVRRHPGLVSRHLGPSVLMLGISLVLLAGMVVAVVLERARWREMTVLLVPWLYFVVIIPLVKQVEPRNMTGVLPVQALALGIVLLAGWERLRARRAGKVAAGA